MTLFFSNLRQRMKEWWSPEEMLVDHWKRTFKTVDARVVESAHFGGRGLPRRPAVVIRGGRKSA